MLDLSLLSNRNSSKYLPIDNIEAMIESLTPLIELAPTAPIDDRVYLNEPGARGEFVLSNDLQRVFSGKLRKKPVRIIDIFSFNGELDLLETRLIELNHVVDHFVIVESTRTHRGALKPLFFDRNKRRFERFREKIIQVVFDDSDVPLGRTEATEADIWEQEKFQRRACWDRAKGRIVPAVADDDVVIHGDLDEIPSGESIYALKYFEPRAQVRNCGVAFHCKTLQWLFRSDHPVSKKHPYTLCFPNLFSVLELNQGIDTRQAIEPGDLFLPGGIHLTYYAYIPYLAYKTVSLAEGGKLEGILKNLKNGDSILQIESSLLNEPSYFELWNGKLAKNGPSLSSLEYDLPSFQCVPKIAKLSAGRLPLLLGQSDPRHKIIAKNASSI